MKKITVLGGGTGTYVVLTGLKNYPLDIGVIVAMMDSGGSTGRLRDQLGVLPPGDLRQCLVALSEAPQFWRRLFLYRFERGDLKGHNFGNIFLSALEKVSPNYYEVIKTAGFVLKTKGQVIPVTHNKTHLCVRYETGRIIEGEGKIDENNPERSRIVEVYLKPTVKPNIDAIRRIVNSNYIIIGPGDLYTSIIPILIVPDIKKALIKSKAKIIYILNLMTKLGQTTNYQTADHIDDLEKYLGRKINYLIVNNGRIEQNILDWYKNHQEKPVINKPKAKIHSKIITRDFIDRSKITISKVDLLKRSILRHDSEKLAKTLFSIIR